VIAYFLSICAIEVVRYKVFLNSCVTFIDHFPTLQVSQLGVVAQKYQASAQNASSSSSSPDLENNCNM